MRFSNWALLISAAAALPLAWAAAAPIDSGLFVANARCAALESVTDKPSFAEARINAEARRQTPKAVAHARAAIADVTARAAEGDGAELRAERALACNSGVI